MQSLYGLAFAFFIEILKSKVDYTITEINNKKLELSKPTTYII